MDTLEALYDSIQRRPRPEDVAQLILEVLPERTSSEGAILHTAARYSFKNMSGNYSSMTSDFARVVGSEKLVRRSSEIFGVPMTLSATDCLNAQRVLEYTTSLASLIHANVEGLNFRTSRMDRKTQMEAGITHKRLYNRQYRALIRLKTRIDAIARNTLKYEASRVAKSAGATLLTKDDLQDISTACFVSYLSAQMNVRSVFTNGSQKRAFDTVAAMLFRRLEKSPTTNWYAVALVHPEAKVLQQLSPEQRGRLLGVWTEMLGRLAGLLGTLNQENTFDLQNMIVQRENDSSSWNAAAGAWNKAREHWISLVYALGMESVLDYYCPGKVLRLMAADVVRWHSYGKGDLDASLHPATKVWRELPRPWAVFNRQEECTRAMVAEVCERHSMPLAGWVEPPPAKRPAQFEPTPELVHGVAVSSPFLAYTLRKAGWFSGKEARPVDRCVTVHTDPSGAAILVTLWERRKSNLSLGSLPPKICLLHVNVSGTWTRRTSPRTSKSLENELPSRLSCNGWATIQ